MRSNRLAALLVFMIPLSTACRTKGSGDPVETPVPVPENLSASGGFESASVAWSPVAGATEYRVYPSDAPDADPDSLTPVLVTTTAHQVTGLANWQPHYFRVSARIGERESELSGEVAGTPTAGWIVSARQDDGDRFVAVHRADDPLTPLETYLEAELIDTGVPGAPGRIGGADAPRALLFGVPEPIFLDHYLRIGTFQSSEPAILAEEPGHTFVYLGVGALASGDRVFLIDREDAGSRSIRSVRLDGADSRVLQSGCDLVGSATVVSEFGIVFRCTVAGTPGWFFSNGLDPAVLLPEQPSIDAADRVPQALTADRAVFHNGANFQLTTQALDGTALEQGFTKTAGSSGVDSLLATAPSGRVLYMNRSGTSPDYTYELWTSDADALNPSFRFNSTTQIVAFGARTLSPDASRFVVKVRDYGPNGEDRAFSMAMEGEADLVSLTAETESVDQALYLRDGRILLTTDAGVRLVSPAGAVGDVLLPAVFTGFLGDAHGFAYVVDPVAGDFRSIRLSDAAVFQISDDAPVTSAAFPAEGRVAFPDGSGLPWLAYSEGSPTKAPLGAGIVIDITSAGRGEGNRLFLRVRNSYDHDLVMFDLDDESATVLFDGTTDDVGYYLP